MCAYEFYTYDDYKEWEGDWELIDGIAYAMASPSKKHQMLLFTLALFLGKELENCDKCQAFVEMDYKINYETVLRPDLSIVCKEDKEENFISVAPSLIVEIVSKKTVIRDEKVKFRLYEKEGVKYYVLIYPDEKKAKVYLNKEGFIKKGDFFEGEFEFELNECKAKIDFTKLFERL